MKFTCRTCGKKWESEPFVISHNAKSIHPDARDCASCRQLNSRKRKIEAAEKEAAGRSHRAKKYRSR